MHAWWARRKTGVAITGERRFRLCWAQLGSPKQTSKAVLTKQTADLNELISEIGFGDEVHQPTAETKQPPLPV